jgi:DNA-binding MarR family transcriptional regulator
VAGGPPGISWSVSSASTPKQANRDRVRAVDPVPEVDRQRGVTPDAVVEAVAPTGLRLNEVLTLVHLRERGPSAQQTLVELMCVDATNLVAVLNSLEDTGLIERRRDRSDRRRAIVALAAPGEQLLAEVDRAFRQVDDEILAGLAPTERQTLNALLSDLVGHIAAGSPQS